MKSRHIKFLITIVLFLYNTKMHAQDHIINQQEQLMNYIGTWYSTDNLQDSVLSKNPKIKMTVVPKIKLENGLQVEVFERKDDKWQTILLELISYDVLTNQIVANGINNNGESFMGKGKFVQENKWIMQDKNFKGEETMKVTFDFSSATEVILRSTDTSGKELWSVKYIKQNPKSKNIGIQLVSVKDHMQKDPNGTLKHLGRMGYSFIENFVYEEDKFYNLSPLDFKRMVESNGMQFKGSMVFKDFLGSSKEKVMDWWKKCIRDHAEAGVVYITTSSNELDKVDSIKEMELYRDYYNEIGRMCKESGIEFGVHNHTKEFKTIENKVFYDYLLEETNPDHVFFEADLFWMKKANVNPLDYFKTHQKRFKSWHVKDEKELGLSGETDFGLFYNVAESAGLKYNIAEIESYNFDPLISAEMAYRFLYFSDFVKTY